MSRVFKPAMMARVGLDWDYRLLDAYHKANTSMVQLLVDCQRTFAKFHCAYQWFLKESILNGQF